MGARPSHFTLTDPSKPLRLYSTAELLNLPAPTWLIEPILPQGGLVGLYGRPGCGKSFVAIDLAMAVATGSSWQGNPTEKGFVLYIGAEGGTGIGKRVLAWLIAHNTLPEQADIAWLVESIPVNADSELMALLLERIIGEVQKHPALIIVDTLARCFDGNENEQEDMGRFISGVDVLRQQFGCTVIVVHHTRLDGTRERGNTAFRGAADTMIAVEGENGLVDLTCDKQKDDEEFKPIALELEKVDGTGSCIVRGSQSQTRATEVQDRVWDVLAASGPVTWDTWRKDTGLERGPFQTAFERLRQAGRIVKAKGLWGVAGVPPVDP